MQASKEELRGDAAVEFLHGVTDAGIRKLARKFLGARAARMWDVRDLRMDLESFCRDGSLTFEVTR